MVDPPGAVKVPSTVVVPAVCVYLADAPLRVRLLPVPTVTAPAFENADALLERLWPPLTVSRPVDLTVASPPRALWLF